MPGVFITNQMTCKSYLLQMTCKLYLLYNQMTCKSYLLQMTCKLYLLYNQMTCKLYLLHSINVNLCTAIRRQKSMFSLLCYHIADGLHPIIFQKIARFSMRVRRPWTFAGLVAMVWSRLPVLHFWVYGYTKTERPWNYRNTQP